MDYSCRLNVKSLCFDCFVAKNFIFATVTSLVEPKMIWVIFQYDDPKKVYSFIYSMSNLSYFTFFGKINDIISTPYLLYRTNKFLASYDPSLTFRCAYSEFISHQRQISAGRTFRVE